MEALKDLKLTKETKGLLYLLDSIDAALRDEKACSEALDRVVKHPGCTPAKAREILDEIKRTKAVSGKQASHLVPYITRQVAIKNEKDALTQLDQKIEEAQKFLAGEEDVKAEIDDEAAAEVLSRIMEKSPEFTIKDEDKHAFFSKKAAAEWGYLEKDGIRVTLWCSSREWGEVNYKYTDKKYLGVLNTKGFVKVKSEKSLVGGFVGGLTLII